MDGSFFGSMYKMSLQKWFYVYYREYNWKNTSDFLDNREILW